jgi:hypothetical protein
MVTEEELQAEDARADSFVDGLIELVRTAGPSVLSDEERMELVWVMARAAMAHLEANYVKWSLQ